MFWHEKVKGGAVINLCAGDYRKNRCRKDQQFGIRHTKFEMLIRHPKSTVIWAIGFPVRAQGRNLS